MKKEITIKGKRYTWALEDMHPAIMYSVIGIGMGLACVTFWLLLVVSSAIFGGGDLPV